MSDETDRDEGRDRRPFAEGADDDLFVWDGLRPSGRPARTQRPARAETRPPAAFETPPRPRPAAGPGSPPRRDTRAARRQAVYGSDDEWQEWLDPGEGAQAGGPSPAGGAGGPFGPDALGQLPERGRPRRRRLSAGAVLAAMLLGFFGAGLLDARAIERRVEGEPLGAMRSVRLALLQPVVAVSGLLRLDRPAAALDVALGRGEEEHHTIAETAEARPKWPRDVTPEKPLRLWIIGDSMAQIFGSSLENLAEDTGFVKARLSYKVSSGLSRPDFFDWPQHMIDQLVEFDPDGTAVLFGANDGQDFYHEGKVLKVGTRAWRKQYAKRVGKAMDILTRGGRRIYWVGNPIMKNAGYRDRIAMMDHIYAAEAAKHPGVHYVSTWKLFSDEKGSYEEYLPDAGGDLVLMRAPDGIHLTRAGGDRMGQAALDVIEKDWGISREP